MILGIGRRALGACVALSGAAAIFASAAPPVFAADAPRTRTVVAGERYDKSGFHEFFFGHDYRDLWRTPATVEVLDLSTEAGGLSVVRRVGGQQTKGLALKGKDGRNYTFRGIEKDASHLLEADLQGTIVEELLQDQMAAQHPASEVVARGLLDAVGVPCPAWRMVVLPDDPALGDFRKDFAGAVGAFGEYPSALSATNPGFRGVTEIVDHTEMYKRLEAGKGDAVDTRALLKARLVDIFMGDWDRHRKQWRWARMPGKALWQPIPEDRDQAFSRYEGFVLERGRARDPRFQNFGPRYGGIGGLTYNGWEQDRRLLVGLSREDFKEEATALRAALTNEAIDAAVKMMPPEWWQADGARLSADLKARRDALVEIADRYYRHLAGRVDVYLTDRAEAVSARRQLNGDLDLSVRLVEGGGADPTFHRVFHASETQEVRIYALSGDDKVTVSGQGGGIKVRVIGGDGNDTLDATGAGNARLSDSSGRNQVAEASLDARKYVAPPPPKNAPWIPPRDWTRETWTIPWVAASSDLGLFLGLGVQTTGYGFRKDPYANTQTIRAGYSFGESAARVDYSGDFRRENRGSRFGLHAFASGAETLRFYGFGNETTSTEPKDFYRVDANQYLLFPSFTIPFGKRASFTIGPGLKYTSEDKGAAGLLEAVNPYGTGGFGEVGVHGRLLLDGRDDRLFPRHGVRVAVSGTFFPKAWDVEESFGQANAVASAYVSGGRRVTLALRAGGKRVFGRYPYFEGASIGAGSLGAAALEEPDHILRGYRSRRFVGDGSLYGTAEARLRVSRLSLVLPGSIGILGFVDTGRVFLKNEDSDTWHTDVGGGIWYSLLNDRSVFSAGFAHSKETDLFYFSGGFTF